MRAAADQVENPFTPLALKKRPGTPTLLLIDNFTRNTVPMRSRTRNQGFTLIELVVVITILGILAAFAVPRFTSLSSSARVAAISSFAGSLQSAAALAHAQYLAAGNSPTSITMEGTTVSLAFGYPDATGIVSAMQSTSGFTPSGTTSPVTFSLASATTPANCSVTYTIATATASAQVGTGGNGAPVISGC